MKRMTSLAALLLFTLTAHAHVLLTTPYVVTGPNGVVAVSAPHCTMTGSAAIAGADGKIASIIITYSFGTATYAGGIDTGFTVAAGAPQLVNVLNMSTGVWTLSLVTNGSGVVVATNTLSGAQLTGAASAYAGTWVSLHDFADYFLTLSGTGLLATPMGTQPDLWAAGDM